MTSPDTTRPRARSSPARPELAYYHGDDGYGLDRAVDALAVRLAASGPVERWGVAGAEVTVGRLAERVGTASLFGGGTVAVVTDPGPLARSKAEREALVAVLDQVAPGNGLVFVESPEGGRRPKSLEELATAVDAAGGDVREFRAPKEGGLTAWIEQRAREREVSLGPGAAKELARRVGGFVREGDVDRRGQGRLAVAELDKLALYRPGATVTAEDVAALVAEVVPGSAWAFLDAVSMRRVPAALEHLDRLLEASHELVVLAQLHRRIRELLIAADLVAAGSRPREIMAALKMKSAFPAEKLVEHSRRWTLPELDAALHDLLEVDAVVRGANGTADEAAHRLAFTMWIAERVAPQAGPAGAGR
jgi:DNA polymerase-3 subunit delta